MSQKTDDQIYRSILQLKYFVILGIVLLVVAICLMIFVEGKTPSFEESARYRPPPESLEAQNGSDDAEALHLVHPVRGQTIYVPAYSHVYHRDGEPTLLAVTLSVRNTDEGHEILVKTVDYYDTEGKKVRGYLKRPMRLAPLATAEFLVEQGDTSGGSGANFLVEWVSEQAVTNPIAEAVMIDTNRQQGISFARSGTVIREIGAE